MTKPFDIVGARPSKNALKKILAATGRHVPAEYHNHIAKELASVKINYQLLRQEYEAVTTQKERDDEIARLGRTLKRVTRKQYVTDALQGAWINIPGRPDCDITFVLSNLCEAVDYCRNPRFPQAGMLKRASNDKDPALSYCVTQLFNVWALWLGLNLNDRRLGKFCSVCVEKLKINGGGEAFKARVRRLRLKQLRKEPPYFYPMRGVPSAAAAPPIGYRPPFAPDLLEKIYSFEDLPSANNLPS